MRDSSLPDRGTFADDLRLSLRQLSANRWQRVRARNDDRRRFPRIYFRNGTEGEKEKSELRMEKEFLRKATCIPSAEFGHSEALS